MVVDTSIILAIFFNERHAVWATEVLERNAGSLRMSTVNLAECLIIIADRQPHLAAELEERLMGSGIRFVPPTVEQSRTAAKTRLRYPLNLGDCFAYALAADEGCPLLTLDTDFRRVDLTVILPK